MSLRRILRSSLNRRFKTAKNFKIKVIALDEISLGLTDMIQFSDADIISALTAAVPPTPDSGERTWRFICIPHLKYKLYARPLVNVIGFEYAGNLPTWIFWTEKYWRIQTLM